MQASLPDGFLERPPLAVVEGALAELGEALVDEDAVVLAGLQAPVVGRGSGERGPDTSESRRERHDDEQSPRAAESGGLVGLRRDRVGTQRGVWLEPEVKLIGEWPGGKLGQGA